MSKINIKALILDMDGVLWRGKDAIGDLPHTFQCISDKGINVIFATNNSSSTVAQYTDKLKNFGVSASDEQIITSAVATAEYLKNKFPAGSSFFLIGEKGLSAALEDFGFKVTGENPKAVVVGLDRSATYEKIKSAAFLIRDGIPMIGTNPDRTLPTPAGLAPGAGSLIAALEAATDVKAVIIGKPQTLMFEQALTRLGSSLQEALVVGDRLETDIAGGQAAGCRTALVLSGVATKEMADAWSPPPNFIAMDLNELISLL